MRALAHCVLGAAVALAAACTAGEIEPPGSGEPAAENHADALALDYQGFDQTPGAGWRVLAERGAYVEAGELIDAYLRATDGLEPSQRVNLAFHAGQVYAFADSLELARLRFSRAVVEHEPADSPIRWNAYVRATIAFLDEDRATLEAMRAEIAAGPDFDGVVPNLDVVDRLLAGLGGRYAEAYRPEGD